jgi:hypothetical protein
MGGRYDLGKLPRVSPHEGVAGSINQTADSSRDSAYEGIEVVLGYAEIVRSTDNQRRYFELLQPGPAVKRKEPSDRATHGWSAIGGQYGLHPLGLRLGKSYRSIRLGF